MKPSHKVLPLFALAALMCAPVSAALANPPAKAPAPVQKVFVPQGFDDNDNVEVILHGHFPNSCMKSGPVDVSVNPDSHVISIKSSSISPRTAWTFRFRLSRGLLSGTLRWAAGKLRSMETM